MKRGASVISILIVSVMPQYALGVEIEGNPRGNGIVLRDHHVKPEKRRHVDRDSEALAEPRHPCTYNGLLLDCDIPEPGAGTVFTPALARQAVAEIPLPGLALHIQPDGETLVNVPTIFWVDPQPFQTSIE